MSAGEAETDGDVPASVAPIDRQLHAERLDGWSQRRHQAPWVDLSDGTFVDTARGPALVWGDQLVGWTAAGYQTAEPRPVAGTAVVLTPPATLAVLRHGYRPDVALTTFTEPKMAENPVDPDCGGC